MSEYPEHEKLKEHKDEVAAMSRFYDWLKESGFTICEWEASERRDGGEYWPADKRPEQLIGGALGIDPEKIEKEKQQMLASLREDGR